MLALTAGARFIGVTNDYRSLFDADNPQLAAFTAFENIYGATNTALIAVAPGTGTVFTRKTLGALEALTEAAWETPYSTRADSLANYNHTWAEEDDLIVEPLVDGAGTLSDEDIRRIEKIALAEPELVGRLVSRDGKVAGLAISFALPDNPDAAVVEITDYLEALLERQRAAHPDIAYHLTGDVPLNRAFADATRDDMETLAPIVFLIIVLAAALLLRSALGTVAIVAVLGFVINSTVGFAGWLGTVFNPANSGVPIIVMTVAVAHSVHIVSSTLAAMGRGLDRNAAIADAIRVNAWPVFLTSLTTAIGFLSLNASDSPPFRVLGNLVAFGVLCAYVYSLTFLPALLSILPLRARAPRAGKPAFFDRFGSFVVARRKILLVGSALVAVVLVTGISRIELTDNWTRYLSERYQFRQDTDFVIRNLTGMETLEYSLNSGREGGITDPAYLRRVEAFADWFRAQPEVFHVQAFSDIMKRLNKNMHGDDPASYRLPDNPELAAQFLLLYELSLPGGMDLNDRIDVGKTATRMTVVMRSLTSQGQRELDARAQTWIRANAPGLATEASGVSIVFAHLSQRNIQSMLTGTIIAMALISLILIFVFR
ncbi:MAG: MMPL family transporter, partial [Rhodospirillaceae bacterium]|nr:MMPL family transporter [Rhodospirillaceae bacterium]